MSLQKQKLEIMKSVFGCSIAVYVVPVERRYGDGGSDFESNRASVKPFSDQGFLIVLTT
jgi:hypothetical protein